MRCFHAAQVQCHAYVWNWDAKMVISGSFAQLLPSHSSGTDNDGSITESDVMGHAAALVWRDWTHVGVANLFTRVDRNGYKILHLSSRPISHAGRDSRCATEEICCCLVLLARNSGDRVAEAGRAGLGAVCALRSRSKSDMLASYWAKLCWAAWSPCVAMRHIMLRHAQPITRARS